MAKKDNTEAEIDLSKEIADAPEFKPHPVSITCY